MSNSVKPRTATCQAPLSMGFSRQEYWGGLPFPYFRESSWPRDQTCVSCVSCFGRQILYHWVIWSQMVHVKSEQSTFQKVRRVGSVGYRTVRASRTSSLGSWKELIFLFWLCCANRQGHIFPPLYFLLNVRLRAKCTICAQDTNRLLLIKLWW